MTQAEFSQMRRFTCFAYFHRKTTSGQRPLTYNGQTYLSRSVLDTIQDSHILNDSNTICLPAHSSHLYFRTDCLHVRLSHYKETAPHNHAPAPLRC